MNADLIERLIQSGTPISLAMEVAAEFGRLQGLAEAAERPDAVAEKRRAWDREYRASKRAEAKMSGGSGGSRVDAADKVDAAPAPDKRNPQTPKKINPTPGVIPVHARETDPGFPVAAKLAGAQLAIAVVIEGLAALNRKRWKGMAPPAGVTAGQWKGFLDHRRSIRKTLTDHAYTLLCRKLEKLAEDGWPPGMLIDLAVERGWTSVFPPRDEQPPNAPRSHNDRQSIPRAAAHRGGRHCAAADDVFGRMDG